MKVFIFLRWAITLFAINYPHVHSLLTKPGEFCYNRPECGPPVWAGTCQTGTQQSPIELTWNSDTKIAYPNHPIVFNQHYSQTHTHFYIQNNGHTIQVHLEHSENFHKDSPNFEEGPNASYVLAQIHLHWGASVNGTFLPGSEHTINGKQYPMEIHLVHYSTAYQNLSQALELGSDEAVTVFGVFIEIGSTSSNPALSSIANGVEEIVNIQSYVDDKILKIEHPLKIQDFLPKDDLMQVFRYSGSLTTPPCTEKVRWIVFKEPIYISAEDFEDFTDVSGAEGEALINNFRPVQPIQGRIVEYQHLRSFSAGTFPTLIVNFMLGFFICIL